MSSRLPMLLIVVATIAVFCGCVWFDFLPYDDKANIYENAALGELSLANIQAIWTTPHDHLFMPITFTLWALLAALSRETLELLHPGVFHAANVVVHSLNAVLVYMILCDLLGANKRRQHYAALGGALVFALHPLVVEPVAWAMGMKDLIAATFVLLSLRSYILALTTPNSRHRIVAFLCYVAALLSKPATATLPLLLMAIEIVWRNQAPKRAIARLAPWLTLGLAALILTKFLQPDSELPFSTIWYERPLVAADAVAFYLQNLIWPYPMSMDFGHRPDRVIAQGWTIATVATIAITCLLGAALHRRIGKAMWLAAALFFIPLLPVLGFVPFGFQAFSTVGARYAYLSLLGAAFLLSRLLELGPWRLAAVVTLLVSCTCAVMSHGEAAYWQNYRTLFARAVNLDPENWTMRYRYGWALSQDLQLADAIAQYQAALKHNDRVAAVHRDLGRAQGGLKRWPEAEASLRRALVLKPDLADTREPLAAVLHEEALAIVRSSADKDHIRAALPLFEEARSLAPSDAAIATNLSLARRLLTP